MKRKTKWLSSILLIGGVLIIGSIALFSGAKDFYLDNARITDISFDSHNNTLSGALVLPNQMSSTTPIVLLVQDDGPHNRFAEGHYLPLINSLLDAGIGVFTWDKPGIGKSTGSWLEQSMNDRSDEVLAAIEAVKKVSSVNAKMVGVVGFSQAGWVVPLVASKTRLAFSVIIGGATNWRDQSIYLIKRKLESQGLDKDQVNQQLAQALKKNDQDFSDPNTATAGSRPDMNPDRFDFLVRNYSNDAAPYLSSMNGPVLALWGDQDKNVDPQANAARYKESLNDYKQQEVAIIRHASHFLLKAKWFNYQETSEWPLWKKCVYFLLGRDAYATRAYSTITTWIHKTLEHNMANH